MSSSLQEQVQRALGEAYLLERELGGGGMSRVFLALERGLGRQVVVKVLLPELGADVNVERFRREIQFAAQLQHPHIVPLLSAGEAEGLPYFIMPFVTGESLRTRVMREGEFPIAEAMRILRDVVSALAYAHARGVMHRDIKPDNVLLSGGVAVVTDFGVAKAVTASADSARNTGLTSLGVALGTPAYMAPEQATASPNTDHRADIYALGVVAYEMLTGFPPFSGRSAQQVLAAHVVEEPEPVERRRPAVPPMLATLVRECLAKRPADRPQTATAVMHTLDAISTPSGGSTATTAVRLPAVEPTSTRRRTALLVGWVAGLALLVGGGGLWLLRTRPAPVPVPPVVAPDQSHAIAPPAESASIQPSAARPSVPIAVPAPSKSARAEPPRSRQPSRQPAPVRPESVAVNPATESASAVESTASPAVAPASPAPAQPPSPPAPAVAAPAPPPRPADPMPEIRGAVADYARAVESGKLADLQGVYPGMTAVQQRGWEQFFQIVRNVKAELSIGPVNLSGGTAEGQITGTYTYLNSSSGRTEHQPVSFHAVFRQVAGRWRMSQVR